ncbi:SIMPL domain-containing protein [uncultured Cyclobacterium sp.]|uniref:SIMPL domain-containing protein n=1 Tax=uncultured Cyclobacterium sp. TaxID=453820 RepID=UPI0030EF3EDA|tara:strand:- start:478838 stop:479548 length:711 start_codon:yes stop_codon:yes gene_type:complete
MMKFDWLKTLVISAAVIIAGFFIGNMHKIGKQYDRTVQVKGLSEREVDADLAVWPINISLMANELNSLSLDIEKQNKEVYNFFISQGFTEDELTKGSTNISDVRADRYNSNAQYSEFRYLAKSEFTVRTDDLGKLQKALSESLELMSKGILLESKNTWRPIEYIFTGLNELKPSMIEEATKNAREVAEKFARDSDSEVGEIRTARQGLFTINDRDENTPQIKTIRVVTTIDFQLED